MILHANISSERLILMLVFIDCVKFYCNTCDTSAASVFYNDLLVFDIATLTWSGLGAVAFGTHPPPLINHGFVSAGGNLFVFGGANENCKQETILHA